MAALMSRSCRMPQDGHVQCRVERLSSASRCPHAEHVYHGEPPCQACRKAASAYHREWSRERRSTRPPRRLKPCGTAAAYHRHRRRGEEPCHACRKAVAAYQRRRYRDKTRRAGAVLRAA